MRFRLLILVGWVLSPAAASAAESPLFTRHVEAVLSRAGCNAGTCHGAVQGKNGFRLSLFGAKPEFDFDQLVREHAGRRIDRLQPERSFLLLKATAEVPHGGGRVLAKGSAEYRILRDWIAGGTAFDSGSAGKLVSLEISPRERTLKTGERYSLRVEATFADGDREDVTALCSYHSLDGRTASVSRDGEVQALNPGDVTILARFRDEPIGAMALVTRESAEPFPEVAAKNFVDEHVLSKLRRLNIPPADVADDATFLRRVRLDVTGKLPTPAEVREFLADAAADKRTRKIEQLLGEPGHAALWTLKFCDLLGAGDYGVYADGLAEHYEAPRFQAWVRARMEENVPYDEFVARILLATSRDGKSLDEWSQEVIALQEGYATPRKDLDLYAARKTLDIYWQRKDAVGVPGAMQIAHAFLGLRLQCAQCHRHPHDVWQQDDVLSFANFFVRLRKIGFEGDNEKKYADEAKVFKQFEAEGKRLNEEAKKLKEGKLKELGEAAKKAEGERTRLKNEIAKLEKESSTEGLDAKKAELATAEQTIAEHKALQQEVSVMEKRGRIVGDESAKRVLHAQVFYRNDAEAQKKFAMVESPLGKKASEEFRLLGQKEPLKLADGEDPREKLVAWMRSPENPYFAKAIVNRVWAHYFDRGLIDPPDDLSPLNPASHPALLAELADKFVAAKYDLKALHRLILNSRTYQQSSTATAANGFDRTNYSHFALRRLPAEVLLDAVNQATETLDDMDMKYFHWPENLTTVEIPYKPQNAFVTFVLEQFGRSERNSSVQCDCQRQSESSLLQVLSLANHPKVRQKIADAKGRVARLVKEIESPAQRVEELYLATVGRLPDDAERAACAAHVAAAESPEKGLQEVHWSLFNTKEFLLQH